MRPVLHATTTLCLVAAALAVSCRRSAPSGSIRAVPSATASVSPAAGSDAGAAALAKTPAGDASAELGPSAEADRRAREHAVLALFSGAGAESLPEVATEPSTPLDLGLRDRLAPVMAGTGRRGVALVANVQTPASIANAARVIAGMRAAFRACYNRSLQTDPGAHGAVRVRAQVAASGEVTAAKATPNAPLPPALIPCVEARVRAAQFAPNSDAKPAEVGFQVTFYVEE